MFCKAERLCHNSGASVRVGDEGGGEVSVREDNPGLRGCASLTFCQLERWQALA